MSAIREEYDVVVLGAGSAGVGAAVGAAQTGARTLLIERYGFAGGAATTSSVLAYCGLYANRPAPVPVVGGVASEIMWELRDLGVATDPIRVKKTGNWIVTLNPEALKIAMDRVLRKADVSVLYHSTIARTFRTGATLAEIDLLGHFGRRRVGARAFVDASGEADLCAMAEIPFSPIGTLQPASFPIRIFAPVSEGAVDREIFSAAASRYNASGPDIPARADGGVIIQVPRSADLWWMALDLPADPVDGLDFSRKEASAREAAWRLVEALRAGGAAYASACLLSSGPQIGVRESRRPSTRATVVEADVTNGQLPEGTVALGGWPIEIHHAPGVQEYVSVGGKGYFGIPFASLQAVEVDNLLVAGRIIGADQRAYGSTRVMGTALATGQAAGAGAASIANGEGSSLIDVQRRLIKQGVIL